MVFVPPGAFEMGDTFAEGDSSELPVHSVYVSAFYMDRTEVTKAFWDEVYEWATNHGYTFDSTYPGTSKANEHPAQGILWFDAMKWCNARSEMEGRSPAYLNWIDLTVYKIGAGYPSVNWNEGYRLPTEAEWEKAARGGAPGQRFAFGDTVSQSQADYYSDTYRYDLGPTRGYHPVFDDGTMPYTCPVRFFPSNGYGLYEMAGNVAEWCQDYFESAYYKSSSPSDPHGPDSVPLAYASIRGGGWYDSASICRTASRRFMWQGDASINVGFRCVLPLRTH